MKVICDYFFVHIKMSYYCFNREELLNKARDRYCKKGRPQRDAQYNSEDTEDLRENSRNMQRNFFQNEK